MYDQGQYSKSLYNQIDEEKHPIIVRNQPPLLYRINPEASWNPDTLLQIEHSEWTHEPREKIWSQDFLSLQLDPKRVVYDEFMIEQPFYIDPVTERTTIMYMGAANPAAQSGKSLYSKDLGASGAVRMSSAYTNRALVRGVQVDAISILRVQDYAWALNSLVDFNPDGFLDLYKKYSSMPVGQGTGMELLNRLGLQGTLRQKLKETMEGNLFANFNVKSVNRQTAMKAMGSQMMTNEFLKMLQMETRTNLFFFWIMMPHASGSQDADGNYDSVMFMISHFVLTGRWISPQDIKPGDSYTQTYVGGESSVGNFISQSIGDAMKELTGSSTIGSLSSTYAQMVQTQGKEAADAWMKNQYDALDASGRDALNTIMGGGGNTPVETASAGVNT